MRRHIAVFTLMGNGHVYPVLPLCSELIRRGFRVTYATSDHYAEKIGATGAEPVIFKTNTVSEEWKVAIERSFDFASDDPQWWVWAADFYPKFLKLTVVDVFPQLRKFYLQSRPDLILYDRFAFSARIIAKLLGCPTIQMSPHFAYYKRQITRENGVCRNPEPILAAAQYLDSFLSDYGITTKGNMWHTEMLNIHFIPKAFQYHGDEFDERYCFVGSLISAPPHAALKKRDSDRPVILISDFSGLSGVWVSSSGYFKKCIDALADSDYQCILSLGDDVAEHSLGPLPTNFEINRGRSHLEILQHATLSICHGGLGSTLEAIYCGLPVLAIPITPETEEVAYRVTELGLGARLSRKSLTMDQIGSSVRNMLRDSLLFDRVIGAQGKFQNSGGVQMAADKISQFLAGN